MNPNPDDLLYMPFNEILKARGLVMAIHNSWWTVHPERGLVFYPYNKNHVKNIARSAPQCNRDETTAKILQVKLWPDMETRFIPLVLQPINVEDYA